MKNRLSTLIALPPDIGESSATHIPPQRDSPRTEKWDLVRRPGDYIHSSAGYYENGKQGIYEVIDLANCIEKHWFEK